MCIILYIEVPVKDCLFSKGTLCKSLSLECFSETFKITAVNWFVHIYVISSTMRPISKLKAVSLNL